MIMIQFIYLMCYGWTFGLFTILFPIKKNVTLQLSIPVFWSILACIFAGRVSLEDIAKEL
jgi:hypothetical protein